MYKKYNSNISRNFVNKINNTIAPQTTRDHFFLRKKSPNIEDLKKNNINLINIKNNININNQDLIDKNYFSSRNINNNINNGPVKLLSMNEETLKNVFSTSSINSNSSLNQNSNTTNKANSMEFLTKINNKDNNSNLNMYISPDRKRLKNKRAQTFELSFSKYVNSFKKRSNDFSTIQSDYKPIFKRRKMKIKKKKTNFIPSHKFIKQLSKIPENINNDNNSVKIRTVNSVRHERNSSTIEFIIENEQNLININKRKSCEINLKENSLIKESEVKKIENSQISSGSLSEEENSLSEDEYFIDRNNNKENTIVPQNKNNIIDFNLKTIKKSNKLLFFEEQIKDKFKEINDNCINIKFNKVENILFILYEYLEQNEENLNIKTINHHIIDDKNIKKVKEEIFNSIKLKNDELFSYKIHKKKDKRKFETIRKINVNFPGEFLYVKYFDINLIYQIKENYLIHDFSEIINTNNETLIRNFTQNKLLLRRKNNISGKEKTFLKIIIPKIKNLPAQDFYYMLNFHQKDYEYFIVPDTTSVKLEDVKLRISLKIITSNTIKNKTRRRSLQSTLKFYLSKDDKLKNIDKNLLKKSLKKNNYFRRLKTIIRPNHKIETYQLKNSYNDIQTKLIEKNFQSSVNKLQMISKANELKYKIFQSLKTHIDEVIFYIKDRNYPGFIQTFEKYKISPDSKDINGDSLLSIAVQSNSFQIVNYLLNAGATPNTKNKNNNTPLHFALTFHNYEIADMLIQRGADEKAINKLGITPWQCVDNGNSII